MSFPQWKGLWDWSMKYADGTAPSGFRPEDVDPVKMKWLEEALKHYMVDFSARMKEIKAALEGDSQGARGGAAAEEAKMDQDHGQDKDQDKGTPGADLEEREALLDELMDIVSSIDYAKDLHKIGGLPVILELLSGPHPSLQWRAAEVVATCVANNPPVQQWFLEGGVLPKLVALAGPSESDGKVRTKALLALSGLVRHFGPGLQALQEAGGLALLVSSLCTTDRRVARKAMTLLTYMLSQRRADCVAAIHEGALPPLVAELSGGGDDQEASDMRQAALGTLIQLASYPATWAAVRDAPGLQAHLAALTSAHAALSVEDQEAQAEEAVLLRQLTAVLAAAAPPVLQPDDHDHVSVEAFEEVGRGTTFPVNELRTTARDAGPGVADQGATATGHSGNGNDGTAVAVATTAAAPLLLGPS
ncbi:hypothetical protein Vretimale_12024 [Volvox reticuliferus]|uniref:Nucleotide exchange factor Fes1 domain-containing protein n=1 Tax=Volvox reticuliferus TaxID=1737510 RepID=A0A8J4GIG1_9CHLO|nr:hypothetical protein Vretifemale_11360 [Volvox reticuliferus]GIM07944.1 hypothetical protein Vretimale_12024 [Volvox reticuliferus]